VVVDIKQHKSQFKNSNFTITQLFVSEFKFEGFSVDTAKSLVASKDVSFAAHAFFDVLCS